MTRDLRCSAGTGHAWGALSEQCEWQMYLQSSHICPCLVSPIMSDVQWLHFCGAEKEQTRKRCLRMRTVGVTINPLLL